MIRFPAYRHISLSFKQLGDNPKQQTLLSDCRQRTQNESAGPYVSSAHFTAHCLIDSQSSQFENSLRRHNYVGLIHALLLAMAKSGKLEAAKEGAKKTMHDRIQKRKEKGENAMDED